MKLKLKSSLRHTAADRPPARLDLRQTDNEHVPVDLHVHLTWIDTHEIYAPVQAFIELYVIFEEIETIHVDLHVSRRSVDSRSR